MTTFKPGDVVERTVDHPQMQAGTWHTVAEAKTVSFRGEVDQTLTFFDDHRWWAAEYFRLVSSSQSHLVATVGKLRLFPASTALARGR